MSKVSRHLTRRLGTAFVPRLRFSKAQVIDVDSYFRKNPSWDGAKYPIPAYQLAYNIAFSTDGPVEYCAHIDIDAGGDVKTEIDLPDLAAHPERGDLVALTDILNLAHSLGVPTEEVYLDMKYDSKSDSLEYLVSYYVTPTDGGNYVTLHIKAHDPKDYFWFKTTVFTSATPNERPNHGSQPTVDAPSTRASCSIHTLRAAGG